MKAGTFVRAVWVLSAFGVLVLPARAADNTREFVPEVNAFVRLSEKSRLFLLGDSTRNLTTHKSEGELGAHLDLTLMPALRPQLNEANWVRDRYLWARVGYVVLSTPDSRSSGPKERRGVLEITGRVPLPNEVWLVNRGRVDLRDLEGEASSQRYRLRMGIEREFNAGGTAIVPYAQAEVFYDTRYDTWNRQLYQFGAEIELTKQWRLEPYYARQNDTRPSAAHVDRVGLVLKYFR
jgi:hypothetical protein